MFTITSAPCSFTYKVEDGKYWLKVMWYAISYGWAEIPKEQYLQARKAV
jgi:hypothetical protein